MTAGRGPVKAVVPALTLVLALAASACTHGRDGARSSKGKTTSTVTRSVPSHPVGGTARVGMWGDPDPSAPTLAGAAARSLVLPQLFVALPNGSWKPSLAAPGSVRLAPDHLSASLRLRAGAVWSNGAPITAADLRRSADNRLVAGVDEPGPDGRIVVHFTRPLVGWERLWSGTASVSAPDAGLFGGPFVVAGYTPGLELVLHRNPRWWGDGRPYLDEVRLEVVPDSTTARQLLAKGDLDVVMPPAALRRTESLRLVKGTTVSTASPGGWWVGIELSPKVPDAVRAALAATVDRDRFVSVLLGGEAVAAGGLGGAGDATWKSVSAGSAAGLSGRVNTVTGEVEEPMLGLLERAMQKRAAAAGGRLELRNAQASEVEGWLSTGAFDAVVSMHYDSPSVCWSCRWGAVDAALANAAEAGDGGAATALEAKLRAQALLVPLWRPVTVVAVRGGLHGVVPNGWALSAAWNAAEWWRAS